MLAIRRRFDVLYTYSVLCAAPGQWENFGPRLSAKHSDYFLFQPGTRDWVRKKLAAIKICKPRGSYG